MYRDFHVTQVDKHANEDGITYHFDGSWGWNSIRNKWSAGVTEVVLMSLRVDFHLVQSVARATFPFSLRSSRMEPSRNLFNLTMQL